MRENEITQEQLAVEIGISACSLNLTLCNKRNFRQDEIISICKVLGIRTAKIEEYFFTHIL